MSDDVCCPPGPGDLLSAGRAEELAAVLKVLADPVRLQLLDHVAGAPGTTVCACHLPGSLGISQPTLSHHLKKLVDAGLVIRERRGRWAHYTLVPDRLEEIRSALAVPVLVATGCCPPTP